MKDRIALSDLLYLDTSKAGKCSLKPLDENLQSLRKGFLARTMQIKHCQYPGFQYFSVLSKENLGASQQKRSRVQLNMYA